MKRIAILGGLTLIILLGAGCVTTSPTVDPRAIYDANFYRFPPSTTVPIGIDPGYVPADSAPATTSDPNFRAPTTSEDGTTTYNDDPKNTVVTQTKAPSPLAYNDALNIYRNRGAYFQFVACRGNPGVISIKKGSKVMLDNRDRVKRTIVVGNLQYNLAAYGFAIATVPIYPGTYYITCNGGGSAAIKVQN